MRKFLEKLKDGLETMSDYIFMGLGFVVLPVVWLAFFLIAVALLVAGTIGIPAGYITMIVFMFKGIVSPWWLFTLPLVPLSMSVCIAIGQDFLDELIQ